MLDPLVREVSANGLLEVTALGGSTEQALMHYRRHAPIQIGRTATKLELQQLLQLVIGNSGRAQPAERAPIQ